MYSKGQSGNPGGRPKGSKDKKWATLQYWFDQLNNDLQHVPHTERVKAQLKVIELILSKKSLPQDIMESVNNSKETLRLIKEFENRDDKGTGTADNPSSVDNRPSQV